MQYFIWLLIILSSAHALPIPDRKSQFLSVQVNAESKPEAVWLFSRGKGNSTTSSPNPAGTSTDPRRTQTQGASTSRSQPMGTSPETQSNVPTRRWTTQEGLPATLPPIGQTTDPKRKRAQSESTQPQKKQKYGIEYQRQHRKEAEEAEASRKAQGLERVFTLDTTIPASIAQTPNVATQQPQGRNTWRPPYIPDVRAGFDRQQTLDGRTVLGRTTTSGHMALQQVQRPVPQQQRRNTLPIPHRQTLRVGPSPDRQAGQTAGLPASQQPVVQQRRNTSPDIPQIQPGWPSTEVYTSSSSLSDVLKSGQPASSTSRTSNSIVGSSPDAQAGQTEDPSRPSGSSHQHPTHG